MGLRFKKTKELRLGSFGVCGLALATFATVGIEGCKGGGGADTVATVNGVPITLKDFDSWIFRKPTVYAIVTQPQPGAQELQVAQPLGIQALRDLVNRQLTLDLAKEMGVSPTQDEISKEIEFQGKKTPNFLQTLSVNGIGLDLVKEDIEADLAKMNIISHGITVTPADIDAYIKANPNLFRIPPSVQALYVLVNTPTEEKQVDTELSTGQDFQSVAIRYSKAPNAAKSVKAPETNLEKYSPVLRQALENTTEGKATPWITMNQNAYVKLYVQAKAAASTVKITDLIREEVRRRVATDKGINAKDLNTRLLAEFKKSKIEVLMDALKPGWKQVADALNGQLPPGAAPAPTSATPPANATPAPPSGKK
jgi:parvulin-like peptidyl-prolyl isomerase